jgi:hypothetical protein
MNWPIRVPAESRTKFERRPLMTTPVTPVAVLVSTCSRAPVRITGRWVWSVLW